MRIAVVGAGAIGSIIAGYLAKSRKKVDLICREYQVSVLEKKGLKIFGIDGEHTVKVNVFSKMKHNYDLVIFAVKTQDLERAYADNSHYLDGSLILTTQNGVQSDNILSSHFEKELMYSSIVMFGATYINTGEVIYNFKGDWIIGKPFSHIGPDVYKIAKELKDALPVVVSDNITGMKWLKLFVNFNNCIPALIGKSMQEVFADLDFCKLSVMLLKEGMKVVKESGIKLESLPNFPSYRMEGLVNMPETDAVKIINQSLTTLSDEPLYGSILQSIMRKRASEIDFINGEVVRLARYRRQDAPLNEKIVDMVHKVENEGKFLEAEVVKKEFGLK